MKYLGIILAAIVGIPLVVAVAWALCWVVATFLALILSLFQIL